MNNNLKEKLLNSVPFSRELIYVAGILIVEFKGGSFVLKEYKTNYPKTITLEKIHAELIVNKYGRNIHEFIDDFNLYQCKIIITVDFMRYSRKYIELERKETIDLI